METFAVTTTAASLLGGNVTETTTVGITPMNAVALHAHAQRASFAVTICAAFPTVGSVTMTTTARTIQTNETVRCALVILDISSVAVDTVLLNDSNVMEMLTAWTIQMKCHAQHVFPTAHTALRSCSSVKTMFASSLSGNVMETMTVGTAQMKNFTFAQRSSVRLPSVSAVITTAAFTVTNCATLWMTAATALMRGRKTA